MSFPFLVLREFFSNIAGEKFLRWLDISKKARTDENNAAADIELTVDEFKAVEKILEEHPVQGGRYTANDADFYLWG